MPASQNIIRIAKQKSENNEDPKKTPCDYGSLELPLT